ncbi:hypothetical protein [Bradyrhizobium sp. SZCCHNR1020]|uniref:hypothetical protein n=1 Tax=Bradyrhizobium sp. SZCCHNR1020 TaxID=3057343 RepID=UPI002915CA5F|nr:hypothetical protein [Bradyrhizobium sp. SZCCHNR1020]
MSFSKRSVLNVGFSADWTNPGRWINLFQAGAQGGVNGSSWNTGSTFMQAIGANGMPIGQILTSASRGWGVGIRMPASLTYGDVGSGQYWVLKFKGAGQFNLFIGAGSITPQLGMSTNVSQVNSTTWKTTPATVDSYFVFNYTGPAQQFAVIFQSNDPDGVGATGNIRNVAFYRKDDEADYLAGKLFRSSYKQALLAHNPGALRFMDWHGGNSSRLTRFDSNRAVPTKEYFEGAWDVGPAYGETTGTNQYSLAAATGTTGNPATTPANLIHGEVVQCRMGQAMVRGGSKTVTAITNANPGAVTCAGHGFSTGDVIWHNIGGMPKLNKFPVTITVVDVDHYTVGIDTTTFGSFTSGSATQYISLNVGGRGSYPVIFADGTTMASVYGNYVAQFDYKSFIFDKSIAALTDGAGNDVYGAWIFSDNGSNPQYTGTPIEFCVALVNELNALSPKYPIDLWLNIPHMGISSMDNYTLAAPFAYTSGAGDYSAAANYGVQMVATVMNGANGYAGLTASAQLLIEYSNETWNSGGSAFSQTPYLARRGALRWPASGAADYASMVALRSTIAAEDIKASAAYAANASRIKFVLSGQGTLGVSGLNTGRIDGTTYFLNDALNAWGNTTAPMTHHDYFAFAAYFDPSSAWDTANLATQTASWMSHGGNPTQQESDCAAYLVGMTVQASGGSETTERYASLVSVSYSAKLASYGKSVIMYEGGWDPNVAVITSAFRGTSAVPYCDGALTSGTNQITGCESGYVTALATAIASDTVYVYGYGIPDDTKVTAAAGTTVTLSRNAVQSVGVAQFIGMTSQNAFKQACKRSRTWAKAQKDFFNKFNPVSNAGYPSMYVMVDTRWGNMPVSAWGYGKADFADIDICWQLTSLRNVDKRRFYAS